MYLLALISLWPAGKDIVTVHFISTTWNQAKGRFVGPVALLDLAKDLLPELKSIIAFPWEWRGWVDLLEGSHALRPALRWRVPCAVLARLWAEHDDCEPLGEAASTEVTEAVRALRRFEYANAVWGHAGRSTQVLHPLDEPRDGAAAFVEDASAVAWSPSTYNPVVVSRRGRDRPHADDHGCVPLFRQWQALHLVELFLAEPRRFAGLDRTTLAAQWPDLAPGLTTWLPWANTKGFATHHSALEALSWHATYVQHALMLAQDSTPDFGMFAAAGSGPAGSSGHFVIRGPALVALRDAETRVAREAMRRHRVDEDAMLAAASWLGHSAVRRRDAGHVKASRAYAELMREAVELAMNLGLSLDQVKGRMRDGAQLLDQLFPVWIERVRRDLKHQFLVLAADFDQWPDPRFDVFDEARVVELVEWLEQMGLFAAHFSVPALMEYGHRPDRDADVAVAVHLASLAAWLEHVCNELQAGAGSSPDKLEQKIPGCWSRHPAAAAFRSAWSQRAIPGTVSGFNARVAHLLLTPPTDRLDWTARDARLAQQIRNEGMHRGLAHLSRWEAHDAACILLRTAMAMWLVGR